MTQRTPFTFDDMKPGLMVDSEPRSALTKEEIVAFARQFDPQPFHLDEEAGRNSMFGGLAASGWHTAAMTMRLMVDAFPLAGGSVGAGQEELRWPKPVYPGDVLRVRVEVLESRPSKSKPHIGLVKTRTTTFNQHDEPVQIMVTNIVMQRG
ncbi:MAG: MaoC family dehydratase [Caulobacteraceae bacterium]